MPPLRIGAIAARLCLLASLAAISAGQPPYVAAGSDSMTVAWTAPLPNLTARPGGSVDVNVPGFALTDAPGAPRLPFAAALIALPPGAQPTLAVQQIEETRLPLPGPISLAPMPSGVARDTAGRVVGGAFAAATATPAAFDDWPPVTLEEAGIVRGVRLARLTFYPARPVGGELWATTFVRVEVRFHSSLGPAATDESLGLDPLLSAVRGAVANPDQAQPGSPASKPAPSRAQSAGVALAIEVDMPGLTALTYADLAAAGFPASSADPRNLRLERAGAEVAMQWEGDDDALFEPGERFLFFAEPRFSRWTAADVYFLSQGSASGLRLAERPALGAGAASQPAWADRVVETNALYTPQCYCGPLPAGRDGDRWTWDDLRRPDRAAATYGFHLPSVATTYPATLIVWFIGYTESLAAAPDHRVDVAINGAQLGSVTWDARRAVTATLSISNGLLHNGANSLTLTLPGVAGVAAEGMWLDAFALRYALGTAGTGGAITFWGADTPGSYTVALTSTAGLRAYDVTDPAQPIRLSGLAAEGDGATMGDPASGTPRRYHLTSEAGLLSPAAVRLTKAANTAGGAQYVIITHADFAPAMAKLAAWRQSQGLTVIVEDVAAIYDTFGDGRPDPAAIRAYLAHAYANWSPRPAYIVLAGDGTFDPKRYRSISLTTYIPPYLASVDPWMGETAADNGYVAVDGGDNLPDMLLGRLPANGLAQAQAMVDKIVAYEASPFPGGWNGTVTFVADDADFAGDFPATSDDLAQAFVADPYSAQRLYYAPANVALPDFRRAILDSWQAGTGVIVYSGHASVHQWAAERLFHSDDQALLTNGPRLPVLLALTCFTGSYHDPTSATLDEVLVRRAGGGAVAVWGASGLGVATGHDDLAKGFLRRVFTNGLPEIGAATLAGKLALAASGRSPDLIDTFLILGDPAMALNLNLVPWTHAFYFPLIGR